MRLTTWNINGLRAAFNKGFFDSVNALETDVLCLQEIKARPDQLALDSMQAIQDSFSHVTWNPAQRPGYSGVATWARLQPLEVQTGLGFEEFDHEG